MDDYKEGDTHLRKIRTKSYQYFWLGFYRKKNTLTSWKSWNWKAELEVDKIRALWNSTIISKIPGLEMMGMGV